MIICKDMTALNTEYVIQTDQSDCSKSVESLKMRMQGGTDECHD